MVMDHFHLLAGTVPSMYLHHLFPLQAIDLQVGEVPDLTKGSAVLFPQDTILDCLLNCHAQLGF